MKTGILGLSLLALTMNAAIADQGIRTSTGGGYSGGGGIAFQPSDSSGDSRCSGVGGGMILTAWCATAISITQYAFKGEYGGELGEEYTSLGQFQWLGDRINQFCDFDPEKQESKRHNNRDDRGLTSFIFQTGAYAPSLNVLRDPVFTQMITDNYRKYGLPNQTTFSAKLNKTIEAAQNQRNFDMSSIYEAVFSSACPNQNP